MDDINKSKIFAFGKLEKSDDSDSEKSLSDFSDEETVSKDQGNEESAKLNDGYPDLIEKMDRLTQKLSSSNASVTGADDCQKRKNYDGSDTFVKQPGPSLRSFSERRNLFSQGERQRGSWTLRTDDHETNTEGLSETDMIWKAVIELHEKKPDIFSFKPYRYPNKAGLSFINCYTPDYRDEEFILEAANVLREHIYFPYVIYYQKYRNYDNIYMHTPNGEFYKKSETNRWVLSDRE